MKNSNRVLLGAASALAALSLPANASTTAFQAAAQANPNLIHQWSFDGANVGTAGADQKGASNLGEQSYGSGAVGNLSYDQPGYDGTSNAFGTHRVNPGGDFDGGAYLRASGANGVNYGPTFSFEMVLSPSTASLSGGAFDLGYVLSSRTTDRGYFLVMGDGNLPSPTHPFSSTLGNGYNPANTNIISGALNAGDWYYVAGTYRDNGTNVTWTNYVANLSAGGPLMTAGPFTNSGGIYPQGLADLGVGGRWDNGEAFPGFIDEVNLYGTGLSASDFAANYAALIPEPSGALLMVVGFAGLVLRRRRA